MNEAYTATQFRHGEREYEKEIAKAEAISTLAEDYIQGLGTLDDDIIIPECFENADFWPAVLNAAAYGQTFRLKEIIREVAEDEAAKKVDAL